MTPGTILGPYEILSQIGAGGMGEVYKARDTRLDRIVAIKTSHEHFTDRFQREAQIIATLNHPNICTLHDVGPDYLVMEYIEGKPAKGPMPLDQLLKYADQICDALDFAHRAGVIHRDLKPSNIMISKQGIKLLDFGVARMPGKDATLTAAGSAVGTPLYMAPELWKGEPADTRSDIYALGVVLNQMLTGEEVAHRTLEPAALERVVRTCMKQDPDERWQSAREVKLALEMARQPVAAPTKAKQSWLGWAMASLFMAIAAAVSFTHFQENTVQIPQVRFTVVLPANIRFSTNADGAPQFAVSPDGKRIVFAAGGSDGNNQLWVRPLDSTNAQPLPGTENGILPFWSPDSKSIGFFAGAKLRRIDVAGGPALPLADAPDPGGGTWNDQGVIVFSPNSTGLNRIGSSGGVDSPVTKLDAKAGETSHRLPWFLPGGQHFLFAARKSTKQVTIRIGSLDSPEMSVGLQDADSSALYVQGNLLFLRGTTLMARPFDARRLAFTAEAVRAVEQVQNSTTPGHGSFSVASNELLVYAGGAASGDLRLTWFDRAGVRLGVLGDSGNITAMSLSPDGKNVAVTVSVGGNTDIWIYNVQRGLRTRFTSDPAVDDNPVWSPDGGTIVFRSSRKGVFGLYRKAADGSGVEQLLSEVTLNEWTASFSPGGKFLAYQTFGDPKTGNDIWVLPDPLNLAGASKPFPFLRSEFTEQNPQFSPDGKWIAYQSDASGRPEIYVEPFPGPGGKRQVSLAGGILPRWRRDGKELFYAALDQRLMAAAIDAKSGSLEVGKIQALLSGLITGRGFLYDVSADGQRFLAVAPPEGLAQEPLTVVQHWTAGLKRN